MENRGASLVDTADSFLEAASGCCKEEASALLAHKHRRCCCGLIPIVVGCKLFLVFYVLLTAIGLVVSMLSAAVWIAIPLLVASFACYALHKDQPKYLYPFLIISVRLEGCNLSGAQVELAAFRLCS